MSILGLFRRFVVLAMEYVTQRRKWKEVEKGHYQSDIQYAEFARPWSARAEREVQEMDYVLIANPTRLGERTRLQRVQIPIRLQQPPKYQLCQHEEMYMQRMSRRRVMIVSNPDPGDDSEGAFDVKIRE